ncbi:hypothetical protein AEAC466_18675 [Asticcacaulis sp. AC466]|nr:hypothetical protein AEAC466_18675 [Asticcacaulis sp. AC466]
MHDGFCAVVIPVHPSVERGMPGVTVAGQETVEDVVKAVCQKLIAGFRSNSAQGVKPAQNLHHGVVMTARSGQSI